MAYPSIISVLATPQPTDRLNSPSHSGLHQNENSAITEIENFVGTLASIPGTLIYDIRSSNSNGGGHVQTAVKGGTGQTSYTKGDLLVGQSASVLAKLGVGINNNVLIADSTQIAGVKWGNSPTVNVQSFVSTGVYTKPVAATRFFIELWGAGGAGGSMTNGTGNAGGGGGGGYISGWIQPSVLSASVIVGVGVGGAGGVGVGGTSGTITVFDTVSSLLTAYAGGGGFGGSTNINSGGGGGAGLTGSGSIATNNTGGVAGDQFGGVGGNVTSNGSVATFYLGGAQGGGGGGGGNTGNGGASGFGGGGGGGSQTGVGGVSKAGGSGSNASVATGGSVMAGFTPAGGGGASFGAGSTGGAGGAGKAIITAFS